MLNKLPLLSLFLTCIILQGCSDLNVKADVAGDSFDGYSTYTWHKDAKAAEAPMAKLVQASVLALVDGELNAKNYGQVVNGEPDFYVNYQIMAVDVVDVNKVNTYSGYGPGFVWRGGRVTNEVYITGQEVQIDEFRRGTLLIDVIDAKTNFLVWRGTAEKKIHGRLTNVEREKVLKTAIKQLFRSIPSNNK